MNLNDFYSSVCLFNNLAGNKNDLDSFKAQMKCLLEEVEETKKALSENNVVDILDGVVDVLYVTLGFLHKLENIGVDIYGALGQVALDNLKKFPDSEEDALSSIAEYKNKQGINVSCTYNNTYKKYILKDNNLKVKKPLNFSLTDLNKYVNNVKIENN